jgi:hypothetical protein
MSTLEAADLQYFGPLREIQKGNQERNAHLLGLVMEDLPCKLSGKVPACSVLVLQTLSPGFGRAPYQMSKGLLEVLERDGWKGRKNIDLKIEKPLFEMKDESLAVWGFVKDGNTSRGPRIGYLRDEDVEGPMCLISPGCIITVFLRDWMYPTKKNPNPGNLPIDREKIPALSPIIMEISAQNDDAEGYPFSFKACKIPDYGLDAFIKKASDLLTTSLQDAKQRQDALISLFPASSKLFPVNRSGFYVKELPKGCQVDNIDEDTEDPDEEDARDGGSGARSRKPKCVTLHIPGNLESLGGETEVDITIEALMNQLNVKKARHAISLLDVALEVPGAVSLFVTYDVYWKTRGAAFRAVPIVHIDELFGKKLGEIVGGPSIEGDISVQLQHPCSDGQMILRVETTPTEFSEEDFKEKIPNPSFPLFGPGFASTRAFKMQVDVKDPKDGSVVEGVWFGYLNRAVAQMSVGKKRKAAMVL